MLVFPVLLLLIMFSIQVALWYHAASLAGAAAQDGVRAARVQGGRANDGIDRANQLLDQAGPSILEGRRVTASRTPDVARVEVRGRCIALVPLVSLPVHAVAESSTELFRGRLAR
ncbi:MAG: pilus assembly protein [Actinomycetota bacterium]|nr:pilus assembly protein [Actinomycetota bacterium]